LVPAEEETALLGAAMLGAVALQQFPNLEACAQQVRIGKTFQPNRALAALYGEGYEHYKAACETVEGRL
jgi:ribulose kinase